MPPIFPVWLLSPLAAGCAAAPPFGGAEEGARLVDAFRLLGRGGGIVDDAGACQE